MASFETFSGRVFPEFGDDNIDASIVDMDGPILVGLDFNVSIMAGVICSKVGDTLHIWDEIAVKNSNTDEVCQMLRQRFRERDIVTFLIQQAERVRHQQLVRQTMASSGNTA